jgi:hypothetical protein
MPITPSSLEAETPLQEERPLVRAKRKAREQIK